jgi:hypothetical protein
LPLAVIKEKIKCTAAKSLIGDKFSTEFINLYEMFELKNVLIINEYYQKGNSLIQLFPFCHVIKKVAPLTKDDVSASS